MMPQSPTERHDLPRRHHSSTRCHEGSRSSLPSAAVVLLLIIGLSTSCHTEVALGPANLSGSGWRVRQGQAVWKPTRSRPELAGEFLLATNASGDFFAQFAKPPFTLVVARSEGDRWQIEFGSGGYSRRGQGRRPGRFAWFQLPAALAGTRVGDDWRLDHPAVNSWRMENRRTGERLEGVFFP